MKQSRVVSGLFILLACLAAALYPWFESVQAQKNQPYVPSGILLTELGRDAPPGRLNVRFPAQDPVQVGHSIQQTLQQKQIAVSAQMVPTITAEIETLATGLENDPLAIYDYVYNHIDYIPAWGLLKNPRETLLAEAGNAFEQAALLTALLRAAGFQTRYVWGNIDVDKSTALNWVGATDPDAVGSIFTSGGIPATDWGTFLRLNHIWVEVFAEGAWRSLDPSFKSYSEQPGQDLRPLLGYTDLFTFTSNAESGATITPDYVQNINQANIRSDLEDYALNLVDDLRAGDTFAGLDEVVGGREIVSIESTGYPAALPYTVDATLGRLNEIPDTFAYELNIQMPGLNYTVNIDEIAGERLTIFYECATPTDCQTLENGGGVYNVQPADDVDMVPKLRVGGTVVATGTAGSLGITQQSLNVAVTIPISGASGQTVGFSQFLAVGEWHALPMRLQTVSNQALDRQVTLLDEALAQGLDNDDEAVLGQILHVLGLAYFNQVGVGAELDSRLAKVVHLPHFSVMIASRGFRRFSDNQGLFLEPGSHSVDVQLAIDTAISAENPASNDSERAWFLAAGIRGSAAEHAIHEQSFSDPAVSTIQVLKAAAAEGQRIYTITPDNKDTVIPLLEHSSSVTSAVEAAVTGPITRHVIISQRPVTIAQWSGAGWISFDPESGSAAYLIAGGLGSPQGLQPIVRGGSVGVPQPPHYSLKVAASAKTGRKKNREKLTRKKRDYDQNHPETIGQEPPEPCCDDDDDRLAAGGQAQSLEESVQRDPDAGETATPGEKNTPDPIDTSTGAFLYRYRDVEPINGLGLPLSFERFYASSRRSLTGTLGYGWSHTYHTRFYTSTDWIRGFGGRTALEAAPALAAAQVGLDLLDQTSIADQRLIIDLVAAQWLMTQITGNAAVFSEPDGNLAAHVRLIDGAYQPPPGGATLAAVTIAGDGSASLDWEDGQHLEFDPAGRPTALDDANGNRTSLSYSQGRLSQVTDAVGRNLTFTYNPQGRLEQITDPAGRTFSYSYDAQGNLQSYTDPLGGVTTYAYDSQHRLTSITDPLSDTFVTNQYDALGRVISQTNGRGQPSQLLYGGDQTILIDPLGSRTTYFYDDRNRLVQLENAVGNRTRYTYDAADQLMSRTNGLSQTVAFAYDDLGRLITTTNPLSHTTIWSYDSAGNRTSFTDRRGQTWQFTYDGAHNLTRVTHPLNGTTVYTYSAQGQLIQAQDPAGILVEYSYDGHGNLTCLTNALKQASCWDYDTLGRPTGFTDGTNNRSAFTYDDENNLVEITDPLGHKTAYQYDANGSLIQATNANSQTTTFTYDAEFNLTGVTDPLSQSTVYQYDANNNLISITDANGHETTYQYNPVGQLVALTDPLSRTVTFSYDGANRLVQYGRADASAIGYQRDDRGQLTGVDYPTGPDITFSYDAAGNLAGAAYGPWSATYTYDAAGRLTTIDDNSRNLTLTYTYDPAGRRTNLHVEQDSETLYNLTYEYDPAARLALLTDELGQIQSLANLNAKRGVEATTNAGTIMFDYEAAGRLEKITDPQGSWVQYSYDDAGRLTDVEHRDSMGAEVAAYQYSYDNLGNPLTIAETTPVGNGTSSYSYDELNRLTRETFPRYTIEYEYDPVGNLTRREDGQTTLLYSYDAADQLQSRDGESFSYDLHGNLSSWQSDHGLYTYSYDAENRLTTLTLPGGDNLSFTYDPFGRRITAQDSVETQGFLHDGLKILLQGNGDLSQTNARYLHGNELLVARYTNQLGLTPYHSDGLENVRYLSTETGQPLDAYSYDAYGRPANPAGIDPNPFRFLGQRNVLQHDLLSILLTSFRYYEPGAARFLTRDPLAGSLIRPQRFNPYPYGLNNPLANGDPSGWRDAPREVENRIPANNNRVARGDIPLGDISASTPGDNASVEDRGRIPASAPSPGQSISSSPAKPRAVPLTGLETVPFEWVGPYLGGPKLAGLGTLAANADGPRWLPVTDQNGSYALACTANNQLLRGAFHAGLFRSLDPQHAIWNQALAAGVGDIAVVDDATYYAGARDNGAFKSNDGGDSWAAINTNLTANDVYALAVDPDAPDTIFAGTEMGLFVSGNGGATWDRPASTPPGRVVFDLTFADNTLVAATDVGLYRSTNLGGNWLTPTVDLPPVRLNLLYASRPTTTTLYAGTANGVYRSTDSGDQWAALGAGLAGIDVHALAVDPADPTYLVAGTTAGLFESPDGGATWAAEPHAGLSRAASQIGALAFCPAGGASNLYLGTGNGVYALRNPIAPQQVTVTGVQTGSIRVSYAFTATVSPITATLPLTYIWQATDRPTITQTNIHSTSSVAQFTWNSPGAKTITATVSNSLGFTTTTHTLQLKVAPAQVDVAGPAFGAIDASHRFTATVTPVTTTLPLTYIWQATDQTPITQTHVNAISSTRPLTWNTVGTKLITVTVSNLVGITVTTTTINVGIPPEEIAITGPVTGTIETGYAFTATVSPITTTLPLTYIWQATDRPTVTHTHVSSLSHTLPFTWTLAGLKGITVRVRSNYGPLLLTATHSLTVTDDGPSAVYLPIILRNQ